ncbi:MAG: aquaporin [Planctomycetes bacterium]|nr:aquaporin [Planctomycetota bacterium]
MNENQSVFKSLLPGFAAEFMGTFALVFFGAGSMIMASDQFGAGNLVTIALAHGLVLVVFVSACMYISGAQFNPAVSIGLIVAGKQTPFRAAVYIFAQLLSAACAAGMLVFLLGAEVANNAEVGTNLGATIGSLTTGSPTSDPNMLGVFGFEFLLTFALMYVILAAVVDDRAHKLGGICVGGTVAACIFAAGPLTGASMNPARTFGPALYGHWDMFHIYVLATVLGACAAALVYRFVTGPGRG